MKQGISIMLVYTTEAQPYEKYHTLIMLFTRRLSGSLTTGDPFNLTFTYIYTGCTLRTECDPYTVHSSGCTRESRLHLLI